VIARSAPGTAARRTQALVLFVALLVPALRLLPNLWGYLHETPERAFLGLGYLANDFRSYASFASQAREQADLFLRNEYTLAPQDGRYLLLFAWITGRLAALVDCAIPPAWWAAQLVTGAGLFLGIWVLLGRLGLDARQRRRAYLLVAFAGGLEWIPWSLAHALSPETNAFFHAYTWPLLGWNTFESVFAPFGTLAYALAIALFVLLLRAARTGRRGPLAGAAALVPAVYAAHGYTAVGLGGILGTTLLLGLARARTAPAAPGGGTRAGGLRLAPETVPLLVLCAAFLVPLAVALWQMRDPVFASSLGRAATADAAGRLWVWPLTHGLLLPLAAAGAPALWRRDDPAARLLVGWFAGAALLAHLPFFSPSRFLFLLHLPLCVAAAIGVDVVRTRGPAWLRGRPAAGLASVALFATNPWVVHSSLVEVRDTPFYYLGRGELAAMRAMRDLPPGGVLSGLVSGTWLPWLSRHPVYLGHWFLTPEIESKSELMRRFFSGRETADWGARFLRENGVRYVYLGPLERSLGRLDPALPLERVLDRAGVEVWRVREGDGAPPGGAAGRPAAPDRAASRPEAPPAGVSAGASPPSP